SIADLDPRYEACKDAARARLSVGDIESVLAFVEAVPDDETRFYNRRSLVYDLSRRACEQGWGALAGRIIDRLPAASRVGTLGVAAKATCEHSGAEAALALLENRPAEERAWALVDVAREAQRGAFKQDVAPRPTLDTVLEIVHGRTWRRDVTAALSALDAATAEVSDDLSGEPPSLEDLETGVWRLATLQNALPPV